MRLPCLWIFLSVLIWSNATVAAPFQSATDAYNQGTTWVKQGQIGMGIWALTHAQRLSPRDTDILANLDAANSRIARPIPTAMPVLESIQKGLRYFRITEWLALWTIATTGLTGALAIRLVRRRIHMRWMRIWVVLWVGIGIPTLSAVTDRTIHRAVVIRSTSLQTSPDRAGVRIQDAPDGTIARVFQEAQGAVRVQLPDGSQGWVKRVDVQFL